MNTSSFSTQAYVLLTPTLNIVDGEQVCSLSISFQDDPLGDEERWVHTMLRCHKSTATYACNNLKKGDRIFISGARYHVDEVEDIRGEIKRTHYFSRGSISKILSAEDLAILKQHGEIQRLRRINLQTRSTDKPPDKEPVMSEEEWQSFIDNEPAEPDEKPPPKLDEDCPF